MNLFKTILASFTICCLLVACSGSKKATSGTTTDAPAMEKKEMTTQAKEINGTWALSIMDTPMGTVKVDLIIEKEGDDYKAYISNGDGKMEIEDFEREGDVVTGSFYSDQYAMTVDFKMNYNGAMDQLKGMMLSSFPVEGKRKM